MSDEIPTMSLTITVPTETDGTHIKTQYGIRFPDGHHEWGLVTDYSGISLAVEKIAQGGHNDTTQRWGKTLARKAEAASIQLSEYAEAHTFLKRQVILVTTAPEEV
jgi:hypothetical protein